jgi:hypothetical protein
MRCLQLLQRGAMHRPGLRHYCGPALRGMRSGAAAEAADDSLWIQPYLLRKWDWGMIWVICIFSGSGHGSIGINIQVTKMVI